MSAKWRSLQHRHKYTYTSVVFPESYLDNLTPEQNGTSSAAATEFYSQLRHLVSLTSTYAQLVAVKDLANAFVRLLASPDVSNDAVSTATLLYLNILFFDESLPLHRTVISALAKCKKHFPLIARCFASLCKEHGNIDGRGKLFLVSRAALSIIGYPKMGFLDEAVESCAAIVASDVVNGLGGVLLDVENGSRPSPVMMEHCQDAMSCMYYLLQRYPSSFIHHQEACEVFKNAVRMIVDVLKSSAFSRDCLVASGVSFCAAIQVFLSSEDVFRFISVGLFGWCASHSADIADPHEKIIDVASLIGKISDLPLLSRLCLLRGILTAIPRSLLNKREMNPAVGSLQTLLYDGILPELCKYCENPLDSHFNFHALTVTQICLQQIKTSILTDHADFSENYQPLSASTISWLLRIVWNNLEDPLSQTVKQAHLIFDLLLDVKCSLSLPFDDSGTNKSFLCDIASDLLRLGPRCKGKYVPLASLAKRIGAKSLLGLNSSIISESIYAYIDDDVCCAVTSFLKCFLEQLRAECWSDVGVDEGYIVFRELCLPPLMNGLVSGHSKLRSNLNTYAIPAVIEVDPDSVFWMLAFISVGTSAEESMRNDDIKVENCIAAMVSLLKVSRVLALVEGDIEFDSVQSAQHGKLEGIAVFSVRGRLLRIPISWFLVALTHSDDNLRIDAAESLFLNPKTASLPSTLELSLLKFAVPLNMRCDSTAFQMKWTSLFRKFFSRVQTALERQIKLGVWLPSPCPILQANGNSDDTNELMARRAEDLFNFIKWLGCFLFNSCYPSGPYERKTMAMGLILTLLDIWPIYSQNSRGDLYPYNHILLSPKYTVSFAGSIIDSWDRLRESSFRILSHFPTPLPGICTNTSIDEFMRWTKMLVNSPRVRESDAGALALRLIFKKYVMEVGCIIVYSQETGCLQCDDNFRSKYVLQKTDQHPVVIYIASLIEWLRMVVEEGERDLKEACTKSFVHGVLLTLRYTFEELDWNSAIVQSCISAMRLLIEKLLHLIVRITSLALWVVSSDAWYMPSDADIDDMVDDTFMLDAPIEEDQDDTQFGNAEKETKFEDGKPDRAVMVGCWLAMKEVSLLFGTIVRKIPLPSSSHSSISHGGYNSSQGNLGHNGTSGDVLDLSQLETMGNHFLQILLKMKHNGAIDKTRAGFSALCNRLLCSNDPRLCKMTESWMELLMSRTIAKGQTVDDLLRRSAGIPAAFVAMFLAEPEGTLKRLLPKALEWLIGIAKVSLIEMGKVGGQESQIMNKEITGVIDDTQIRNMPVEANGNALKVRDEGVVPTVHAFNVLRAAFNDTNLAADTSGFCAEAMIVSIRTFSSSYWEIRNGACLAYAALVRRMIGFFNVQKRESARRSLTSLEFFHRFPALHPFLFEELKVATQSLDGSSARVESNIAKGIHPSVCPILILLSRLKPSPIDSAVDDALDPFVLIPFIQRCATQSNLRIRVLASRALTGLVSNEKLLDVIKDISMNLPYCVHQAPNSHLSFLEAVESSASTTFPRYAVSYNLIHGLLLQLSSLLDCNCRSLVDPAKMDQILDHMIPVLSNCSWLGSTEVCPCPILNSSYIKVLDLMLDVARLFSSRHTEGINAMLFVRTSDCLHTRMSHLSSFHDPTRVELHRQAVMSYFSCLGLSTSAYESSEDKVRVWKFSATESKFSDLSLVSLSELNKQIISCISDPSYELRAATLKRIFQLLKAMKIVNNEGVLYQWAWSNLHNLVVKRLLKEDSAKCVYYILKIIFLWNAQISEPSDAHRNVLGSEVWERLNNLNVTMLRAKTREAILCCMGVCIRQYTKLIGSTLLGGLNKEASASSSVKTGKEISFSRIDSFISLVKIHSAQSEPVKMRRAAAEAIIASSLLEEAVYLKPYLPCSYEPSASDTCGGGEQLPQGSSVELVRTYALKILDLWFVSIQLLEDEDSCIRDRLGNCIQNIVTKVLNKTAVEGVAPMQVDRVIELCFEYLSSVFGHWLEYLNHLLRLVSDAGKSLNSHGDLVRQIFEKEIDNHHEEKLLISQMCCMNAEKILSTHAISLQHGESNIEAFLSDWSGRFLHQLLSLLRRCHENAGLADWIGGIGNHKDTFLSVYANLLALYALTKYSVPKQLDETLKSELVDLELLIVPFHRNPLISALYSLLLQRYKECGFQVNVEDGVDSNIFEGFEPYFLR